MTDAQTPTREAVLRVADELARSCGWPSLLAMRTAILRERCLGRLLPSVSERLA